METKKAKLGYFNIVTVIIMVVVLILLGIGIKSQYGEALEEKIGILIIPIFALLFFGVVILGTFILLREYVPVFWSNFKKVTFVLLLSGILGAIGGAYYYFVPWTYPNWSAEKKMAYQFMLIERKLLSNSEKCNKVTVVIQKENWKSDYDTIFPTEAKKLMAYPTNHSTKVVLPFTEFGNDCQLSLEKYAGKVHVSIIKPIIIKRVFDAGYGVTATTRSKVGTQEYPYAQGNLEGGMFAVIPDKEFNLIKVKGLQKANKILKRI